MTREKQNITSISTFICKDMICVFRFAQRHLVGVVGKKGINYNKLTLIPTTHPHFLKSTIKTQES